MVRKSVVLITGASGEIGHGLIERLSEEGEHQLITIDLRPLEPELKAKVEREFMGSILEKHVLEWILPVVPVLLGGGLPLFPPPATQVKLALTGHRVYQRSGSCRSSTP